MTKIQGTDQVGDTRSPPLNATESSLRVAADQAQKLEADSKSAQQKTSDFVKLAQSLKAATALNSSAVTCKQIIWLSFFFDGTGNNLQADIEILKHSNVARLFRAHKGSNEREGIFSVYIPGIGTYFPEIGDDGGGVLGLGCGAMGEERLNFALDEFDRVLKKPLARAMAPTNSIVEINIAIFGFSRGAALARAFVNMLMERRCNLQGKKWLLKKGSWPVRFRFMGLFDTVASVGLPMSSNTTGVYESARSDTAGMILNRLKKYEATRPEHLAFASSGQPGADPAPGDQDGHLEWGARLVVHETVEEVRHFIAAHELRNSFPVDSVSILSNGMITKPPHFFESIYAGVHSDVGGGYAPGEGGRGILASESLSLIPLRHMFDHALRCGVPMAVEWLSANEDDFNLNPLLRDTYDHYLKVIGPFSTVGDGINRHMKLYYAWRFLAIRRKANGDKADANIVDEQNIKYRKREAKISKEVATLKQQEDLAKFYMDAFSNPEESKDFDGTLDSNVPSNNQDGASKLRKNYARAHDARMRATARKDAIPNMRKFRSMLDLYDRQLLADVRAILLAIKGNLNDARIVKRRADLRPHYKALLEAYEDEFTHRRGLADEKVIRFFDSYVHDSLAGFAKDATLPSDPRVVYLGGNEKYKYAELESQDLLMKNEVRIA